jgi:hypothetical protein
MGLKLPRSSPQRTVRNVFRKGPLKAQFRPIVSFVKHPYDGRTSFSLSELNPKIENNIENVFSPRQVTIPHPSTWRPTLPNPNLFVLPFPLRPSRQAHMPPHPTGATNHGRPTSPSLATIRVANFRLLPTLLDPHEAEIRPDRGTYW